MTDIFLSEKSIEWHSFINEDIYDQNTSLSKLIQKLSDPNVEIQDSDIVNLLLKFFFAYRFPSTTNSSVDIRDINKLLTIGNKIYEFEWDSIVVLNWEMSDNLKFFHEHSYGLQMIGDIASSVSLFRSIVDYTLQPEQFDNSYVGLDLWTGTWWLLLAQYICAQRNDFHNIYNYGIEIDKTVWITTQKLFDTLGILDRSIIYWDTTRHEVYDTFRQLTPSDIPITFISNETICNKDTAMSNDNKKDPFFQNIAALDIFLWDRIDYDITQGFPTGLQTRLWYVGGPNSARSKFHTWNLRNKYTLPYYLFLDTLAVKARQESNNVLVKQQPLSHLDPSSYYLESIYLDMMEGSLEVDSSEFLQNIWSQEIAGISSGINQSLLSICKYIFPVWIQLWESMVDLHDVGREYLLSGLVLDVPFAAQRWPNKRLKVGINNEKVS